MDSEQAVLRSEPEAPRGESEVVCMSPTTGSLFTTTVEINNIPRQAVEKMLPENVL